MRRWPLSPRAGGPLAVLLLHRSRALLSGRFSRTLLVSIAVLYAFLSMVLGGMLLLARTGRSSVLVQAYAVPYSPQWWDFPALVVVAPGGELILPFFPTLAMTAVSLGVGFGMTAGLVLSWRVLRSRRTGVGATTATNVLAGVTPGLLAALTLGACCSVAASSTGSFLLFGRGPGEGFALWLASSWYLWAFQLTVLGLALLAQEKLLEIQDLVGGNTNAARPTRGDPSGG